MANSIISKVKASAVGMKVQPGQTPGEQFISLLGKELVETMGSERSDLVKRSDGRPSTILMAGLQGVGKTTAAAKLANYARTTGYGSKVLLVAADVYRPAAVEQLRTLGERLGVEVYFEEGSTQPVKICRNAMSKAMSEVPLSTLHLHDHTPF